MIEGSSSLKSIASFKVIVGVECAGYVDANELLNVEIEMNSEALYITFFCQPLCLWLSDQSSSRPLLTRYQRSVILRDYTAKGAS